MNPIISGVVGNVLGGFAKNAVGKIFGDKNPGIKDAITGGIDTHLANRQALFDSENRGSQDRAYLNSMYPELTPWAQAGANQGRQSTEANAQKLQERMQARELQTREKIAGISAAAQIKSASISSAPQAAQVTTLNRLNEAMAMLNEQRYTLEFNADRRQDLSAARNALYRIISSLSVGGEVNGNDIARVEAIAAENAGNMLGNVLSGLGLKGILKPKDKGSVTETISVAPKGTTRTRTTRTPN